MQNKWIGLALMLPRPQLDCYNYGVQQDVA